MKKCHAKNKMFWLNNCFSNLAILYGLHILAMPGYISAWDKDVSIKYIVKMDTFMYKQPKGQRSLT